MTGDGTKVAISSQGPPASTFVYSYIADTATLQYQLNAAGS
jgi:hypothetical protein